MIMFLQLDSAYMAHARLRSKAAVDRVVICARKGAWGFSRIYADILSDFLNFTDASMKQPA
jgi:hypothetical protein